jgi:L-aminopeptidase/D-esterase-like protein
MDYKDKYLKYKEKYLQLKNINMLGGGIKLSVDNTQLETMEFLNNGSNNISDSDILKLLNKAYGQTLTEFIPNSAVGGKALIYKLKYTETNELVGIAVVTDLDQFKSNSGFKDKGGIVDKKGLYITSVAGNPEFSGVVGLLFNKIISDAESSDYDYLLLEAKKYEHDDYLPKLYGRFGFVSIKLMESEGETGTLMCRDIKSDCQCVNTIKTHFGLEGGAKKNKQFIKSNDNMDLVPKKSTSKHYIKLEFPNIKVAQCEYSEGPVGLTFIDFKKGARVHMEARGGYPGYIDCLSTHDKHMISGINIAGGSLLGLESTTGLTAEEMASTGYKSWPGFNGAIIYSQNLKNNKIYPDKALGRFAYHQSDDKLYNGKAGVGVSAGHGQGWGFKQIGKIKILALCVNNAIGVVYKDNKRFHYPSWANPKKYDLDEIKLGQNTTIIVVITNLELDSDDLRQLNQQVNVSIGESIRPFNTFADGDILYTCSTLEYKKKLDVWERIKFFDECSEVLKEAILNSTK